MISTVDRRAPRRALTVVAGVMLAVAASASFAAEGQAPASSPAAPQAPLQIDAKVKIATLDHWDAEVDSFTKLAWQVNQTAPSSADLGGRDFAYYWQTYVFTPPTKEALEQLRDKAQKQTVAKDTAGLQRTFDEASAILSAERGKAIAVSLFLSAQAPVVYHQYQLGPWLARAPEADREGINNRVSATYDRLLKELDEIVKLREPQESRVTAARFFGLLVEPAAFFNSERARMIKAQADLPNPVAVAPLTRGDKPCPAPVPPAKGRDKPSLGADFPSSEDFYPRTVKFNDVEGSVTLRVSISATGCIERAEVVGTSGVAELDTGALQLAMAGSYVPAAAGEKGLAAAGEKGLAAAGEKGAPGTMMFRVKFEQSDAFEAAR